MRSSSNFFSESRERSSVKARIVSKYFFAWAKVIISPVLKRNGKIAYLDLFAGPGRYKNGTRSTPLLVLEQAIGHAKIAQSVVTIFNDKDENHTNSLESEINSTPGIEKLKHPPIVLHEVVGFELVNRFESLKMIPTFFFVDPFGYKGLSLRLINSVLKDWGCDCVFFFNYSRINAGISNPLVADHMNALFGRDRANSRLRFALKGAQQRDRETFILNELRYSLGATRGRYVLPFRFLNNQGMRVTHYLIFVTKKFIGYEIMSDIMAHESSSKSQGVASFEYFLAQDQNQSLLELTNPLDELQQSLLEYFSGRQLKVRSIYENHEQHQQKSFRRPHTFRNYKDALIQLQSSGKITRMTPAPKGREETMGKNVMIKFPPRKSFNVR